MADTSKESDDFVIKPRSSQNCIATGFRVFTKYFKQIFRQSWLPALLFSVFYSAAATWLLLNTSAPILSLAMLYILGMLAALLPALTAFRRIKRKVLTEAPHVSMNPLKVGWRHCGFLCALAIVSTLFAAISAALLSLPAIVLALANTQANLSTLIGDAYAMPAYMTWLTAAVMFILGFLLAFVVIAARFPVYYAYTSIAAQKKERQAALEKFQHS